MREQLYAFGRNMVRRLPAGRTERALLGLAVLATALPILVMLTLLVRYSVNVPWWDQLSFVDLMRKAQDGSLTFYDLWAQHNEHRILVPQAVELAVGSFTGFNFRVPVLLNLVVSLGSFGLLAHLLYRLLRGNRLFWPLLIITAWLLFSPLAYVNWIWGFQLAFYLSVGATVLTVWLLTRRRTDEAAWLFALAVVSAAATTYTNGNGLVIWPIGLGLLWLKRFDRRRLLLWCGAGLLTVASYFYKFHRAGDSPKLTTIMKEPVAVAKYIFAYIGRSLGVSPVSSRYVGFTLIVVMVISAWFLYKKGRLPAVLPWLALAAYSLLTALLAAMSRLNFGPDHGFVSNSYPTFSVLFVIAAIILSSHAVSLWVARFSRRQLATALTLFFLLGAGYAAVLPAYVTNYQKGLINLRNLGNHHRKVLDCVYGATSPEDDCLLLFYPDKATAWHYRETLRELRWGDF